VIGSENGSLGGGTQAVLVGFDTYERFNDLPAVANNLKAMRRILADPDNFDIPMSNITTLRSSKTTVLDVVRALEKAAHAATDTLIFYFTGHGNIDDRHPALHLILPRTDPSAIDASAVRYDLVRSRVSEGPNRRIVILDCCMSGRALSDVQGASVLDTTEISGTAVFAACADNELAKAPKGAQYTAFTAALISVLEHGLPGVGQYLLTADVFTSMHRDLLSSGFPEPQLAVRNRAGDIPFGRNRAWSPRVAELVITPHLETEFKMEVKVGKQRQLTPEETEEFFEKVRRGELKNEPLSFTKSSAVARTVEYSVTGADELRTTIAPWTHSSKSSTEVTYEDDADSSTAS
jgi:hypothetical protein